MLKDSSSLMELVLTNKKKSKQTVLDPSYSDFFFSPCLDNSSDLRQSSLSLFCSMGTSHLPSVKICGMHQNSSHNHEYNEISNNNQTFSGPYDRFLIRHPSSNLSPCHIAAQCPSYNLICGVFLFKP